MTDPLGEGDSAAIVGGDLLTPGGKVDEDKLRERFDQAREAGADEDEALGRVEFVLQRDLKTRLDKYLTTRITFMSRSQIQRLIECGAVEVNGREARAATKLRLNDKLSVTIPPPSDKRIKPEPIDFNILFEDEHIIVLNKQPDIIVHPARTELSGTMINGLAHHFLNTSGGELSAVGAAYARPGVVHRLDRNTTGCIVFAKEDAAHWHIGRQFEERTVDKRYLAVVHGNVEPDTQVIDLPLGPHPSKEKGYREKIVVRHDDLGRPSVTICRVRERYRLHDRPVGDQQFTLVELELKTGRTHQIRVHLSHNNWPIVGDDMYGGRAFTVSEKETNDRGDSKRVERTVIERQALHAALLAFEHPKTGEPMVFTAPPPADFVELVRLLRQGEVERPDTPQTVPLVRLGLAPEVDRGE